MSDSKTPPALTPEYIDAHIVKDDQSVDYAAFGRAVCSEALKVTKAYLSDGETKYTVLLALPFHVRSVSKEETGLSADCCVIDNGRNRVHVPC